LEKQRVVGALCVGHDERGDARTEGLELELGLWLEERHLGDVNGLGRIVGVGDDGSGTSLGTASTDSNIPKHVGSVCEVGLLLGTSESLTFLALGLLVSIRFLSFSLLLSALSLMFGNSLTLGLLSSSGGGGSLLLGLGGLLLLLTLGLGVIGIPRI
jgi:hypothetical protein